MGGRFVIMGLVGVEPFDGSAFVISLSSGIFIVDFRMGSDVCGSMQNTMVSLLESANEVRAASPRVPHTL